MKRRSQLEENAESPYRLYGEVGLSLRDLRHVYKETTRLLNMGNRGFRRISPLAKHGKTEVFPEHLVILPKITAFYATMQCM